MISEVIDTTMSLSLSYSCQKAYEKIKELIKKIFSLIKDKSKDKGLKEEFQDSYIDFARKLKTEGHHRECYNYMAICSMYYNLMDDSYVFIAHESFFTDLFDAFDELLFVKLNKPEEYEKTYREFTSYMMKMHEYYYRNLAAPSPFYDDEVCSEIISCLSGDL